MHTLTHSAEQTSRSPIAILTWEINPMVAGGSWTACYHFVRKLKEQGVEPVVVAPWRSDCVDPDPFDCRASTVLLGILGREERFDSPFASSQGPYRRGSIDISPYGAYRSYTSLGYGRGPYRLFQRGYSYGSYAAVGQNPEAEAYLDFMNKVSNLYTESLIDLARRRPFAVIHAQDWVTFNAAEEVSRVFGIPWIAHFHSLERDRRPWSPDAAIEHIERKAANAADFVVTPSKLTARCIAAHYGVSASKIVSLPNVLSRPPGSVAKGRFDTRRVIFLGRLELQKAPDRFAKVAAYVRAHDDKATFQIFGDGELRDELARYGPQIEVCGPLSWNQRWSAFEGATALFVPSRAEPFGMVILEAMQCGVPVLYSSEAGAAEVITSGIPIHAEDIEGTAEQVIKLVSDAELWESVAEAERLEIGAYPERDYERHLLELYASLCRGA